MKKIFINILTGSLLASCVLVADDTRIVAQDNLVTVKYSTPGIPLSPQNGRRVLYFKGKAYENPVGVGVRYVRIPNKDMIVFVTKRNDKDYVINVVPIEGRDAGFQINIGNSLFGQGLGRSDKSDPQVDYIEAVRGDLVIFRSKSYGNGQRFALNLRNRSFAVYN